MKNYKIPNDIEKDAKVYMDNVLKELENRGVLEQVDSAALTMLARNYSMFIKASKQLEDEGLTVTSDRGNVAPHPAIKMYGSRTGRSDRRSCIRINKIIVQYNQMLY